MANELPFLTARDAAAVPGLLLAGAASRFLPARAWPILSRSLALVLLRTVTGKSGTPQSLGDHIRRLVGDRALPVAPHRIRLAQATIHIESFFHMFAAGRDPSFGRSIRLEGREHLDRALAAGRGAVLHLATFQRVTQFSALPAHGYHACRITDETHGYFLTSAFGVRRLHPLQVRLEQGDQVERIVAKAGSLSHLRVAMRQLRQNRPVIFRILHRSLVPGLTNIMEVPFLDGSFAISATPLRVAVESRAPVIPMYPVRAEDGEPVVIFGAPLTDHGATGRREQVAAMARDQAVGLEKMVLRFPEQWADWNLVEERSVEE